MSFCKLSLAFAASIMFADTAFADENATITPVTDAMVVDQSIQKAGGSVDLMYVMLEDPDVSALQNFCVGGCDIAFRIAYRSVEDEAVAVLQVVSVTPVSGGDAPELSLEDPAFLLPVESDNAAEFFSELREKVRRSPEVLFDNHRAAS